MKALVLGSGSSGRAAKALLASRGFEDIEEASSLDIVVASPGVRVVSELQLGVEALKARGVKMIAVTGSKGKSSVVKLVAEALGGVPCGNYGLPVSAVRDTEWAVVEVSSFQLETTNLAPDAFEAAAILNLQDDHLDRHGSRAAYHAVKRRLLSFAKKGFDCSAPNADALLAGSYFDNEVLRLNGAIAAALMREAGLEDARIREAFLSFKPLDHRMQRIATIDGVIYIDDSKATSIAALAAGVRMAPSPVLLIAGGLPKGDNPEIALPSLTKRVKKVYTIGRCAEEFAKAWRAAVPCEVSGDMRCAVESAMRDAVKGDTVLLSPGAASFDQFHSFEERGDVFADLVKKGKDKR